MTLGKLTESEQSPRRIMARAKSAIVIAPNCICDEGTALRWGGFSRVSLTVRRFPSSITDYQMPSLPLYYSQLTALTRAGGPARDGTKRQR